MASATKKCRTIGWEGLRLPLLLVFVALLLGSAALVHGRRMEGAQGERKELEGGGRSLRVQQPAATKPLAKTMSGSNSGLSPRNRNLQDSDWKIDAYEVDKYWSGGNYFVYDGFGTTLVDAVFRLFAHGDFRRVLHYPISGRSFYVTMNFAEGYPHWEGGMRKAAQDSIGWVCQREQQGWQRFEWVVKAKSASTGEVKDIGGYKYEAY